MNHPVITISGLTKQYGALTAVDNLHLSIDKGEVFGLLGPNGAGKSTTILMLLGLTEPTAGTMRVCGIDPTTRPIEVKRKVGYLPDDVGFYDNRSGLDNLLYTASLNRMPRDRSLDKAHELLEQVGLTADAGRKAGAYSRGMRQRQGLADVLIKDPEIIILDEPTLGIDPKGVREFLDLIVRLSREQGITVLLSSHHLHQVQQVCDRVGLFVRGSLIAEGDIATLSAKLFGDEPFLVEADVICPDPEKLQAALQQLDGVGSLTLNNGSLHVGCSRDLTAAIARTVVGAGFGLTRLQKKIHGLDDIYHRYFEGGNAYGKTA
jgi:ABC-2 type transport system ATP-binding protein